MRIILPAAILLSLAACAATRREPPLTINSPQLDSGIRGSGGGGLGGEATVGRPTGAGILNRVTVP